MYFATIKDEGISILTDQPAKKRSAKLEAPRPTSDSLQVLRQHETHYKNILVFTVALKYKDKNCLYMTKNYGFIKTPTAIEQRQYANNCVQSCKSNVTVVVISELHQRRQDSRFCFFEATKQSQTTGSLNKNIMDSSVSNSNSKSLWVQR